MGRKKGKGSKKGKRIVDGIAASEMSREQLLGHVKRLQNELEREREERNFFMLEREKLFSLWSRSAEKIKSEQTKCRLREIDLEEVREQREEDMTLQKQKIRYLMTEQMKKTGRIRLTYLERLKIFHDELWNIQSEERLKLFHKDNEIRQLREAFMDGIRSLKIEHCAEISKIAKEYGKHLRRIEVDLDKRIKKYQDNLELESKQDILQLQIAKDEQINTLINEHEDQLRTFQKRYNDIIEDDFVLIEKLENQLHEKKLIEENLHNALSKSKYNCSMLTEKVTELETKMVDWSEENKLIASRIKHVQRMDNSVKRNKEMLKQKVIHNEIILQKNLLLQQKLNDLKKTFMDLIIDIKMKSAMSEIMVNFEKKEQH